MKKISFFIALSIMIFSCNKPKLTKGLATITTKSASASGFNKGTSGGVVVNNGGNQITETGICYDTFPGPTTAKNKLISGIALGSVTTTSGEVTSWTTEMPGLLPNKTYYIRAFAINSAGTAYGNEVTLKIIKIDDIVCSGQPWAEAANYDSTRAGIHPIIYYTNSSLPQQWQTSSLNLVELVVCETVKYQLVETCYYTGNITSTRTSIQLDLVLRSARSSAVIATKSFYSSSPQACPQSTTGPHYYYGVINYNEVNNWLQHYVVR